MDESIKPVQKRRPVPLKYVERFEDLLDDLKSKGVVSGPLDIIPQQGGYIIQLLLIRNITIKSD